MHRLFRRLLTAILVTVALCVPAFAGQEGRQDRAYVVTVAPSAAADGVEKISAQLAATYGGTLAKGADAPPDAFVLRISAERARVLAADPRVISVAVSKFRATIANAVEVVNWTSGVSYTYDGSGNIGRIGNDAFVYDDVGRLVEATVNSVHRTYTYDGFGNRTACTQFGPNDCQAFSINAAENKNRIAGAGYDAAGNVTSLSNHVYAYDPMNMMTRDTNGSLAREFVYTADDERIASYTVGSSWNWTIRGADGKVLRELTSTDGPSGPGTASWQWAKDYVWRDGLLLASRQPDGTNTTIYHYHLDHLGTPRRVTDQNDHIVGVHDYLAFGPELSGGTAEPSATALKYTGHERDRWSGSPDDLDYMHARYYSSLLGRFLSVDPAEGDPRQPQSWNRYAYVMNNPVNHTDPTGKCVDISQCWMLLQSLQQVSTVAMEGLVQAAAHSGMGNIILGQQTGDRQRMMYGQAQLDHEVLTLGLLSYMDVGPSSTSETSVTDQLADKADEVHAVLDPIAQTRRTTAVLRTSAGDIVAGGTRDLEPAQRAVVAANGDIAAKLAGAHAEVTALAKSTQLGATPEAIVATRPFCSGCLKAIQDAGGKILDALTAVWP